MPIEPIDVSRVEAQAENIYEAIVVMSKRARQINEDIKIQLNQRLETLSSKAETDEEVENNPDQVNVSLEFEQLPKPTIQALAEMLNKELEYRYKESLEQ